MKDSKDGDRRYIQSWANIVPMSEVNDDALSIDDIASDDRDYFHEKMPWSISGLAMFAQSVLCESYTSKQDGFDRFLAVYAPRHIYDMFSVYLKPLLGIQGLATDEGLQMVLALGETPCYQ